MAHFAKITSQGLLNITWLVILLLAYRKNGVIETFQSDVAKRWLQPSAKRSVNKAFAHGTPISRLWQSPILCDRIRNCCWSCLMTKKQPSRVKNLTIAGILALTGFIALFIALLALFYRVMAG
jgi:hypothetical protein